MRVCILTLCILFIFSACTKKPDLNGNMPQPGVAITFDDNAVDNWHRNLGLLDSLGIRATFYVSAYHTLSNRQKELLKRIQARGHEIEYHSTNHRNLDYLVNKKGWGFVYEQEIKPDLELMRKDGYEIRHFAYPFGKRNSFLDNRLLGLFFSVRGLDGTANSSNCFAVGTNSRVLQSMGIDESSKSPPQVLRSKLQKAITDHKCLILLGHEIDNHGYKYHTSRQTLRLIAEFVRRNNMRFYRIDEIARR